MGFIGRLKKRFISLCVFVSVVLLCVVSFVPSIHAEANANAEKSPDMENSPQASSSEKNADPNALPENADAAVDDPNDIFTEDDDDFSPRLSTYIEINQAFENIFNPELITDQGLVDYGTLRRKRHDLIRAEKALKRLNPAVVWSLSKEETIAFWINTYNVCTLQLVIEHYPIEPKLYMIFYPDNSIMQISGNWRTKEFFDIQRQEYTLQEIEWNFLLDAYKDPRLIFALSYASRGGAILRNKPYTAEKLDQQLDDQVRKYLQNPQGLRFDKEDNILYLSNLFTMHNHRDLFLASEYADILKFRDRDPDERAWLNFIWNYLSPEDRLYLETASPDIRFMKYDWHLNEKS